MVVLVKKCSFLVILTGLLLSACSSTSNDYTNVDEIEPITEYDVDKDDSDRTISIETNDDANADLEGIVLDIGERGIKLARNLTLDEYEEIKDEPVTKLHNEYVEGERDNLGLIDLIYDKEKEFNKGDKVEVWIEGDIMEISPPRAKAKKIVMKQ